MRHRIERGFTYIGILVAIVFAGTLLAVTGEVWSLTAQRENEEELQFIGRQMVQAIDSYYRLTPRGQKRFPATLDDLVRDKRWPEPRHHLRKVFYDPLTAKKEWGLIKTPDGLIRGVYSLSSKHPLGQRTTLSGTNSGSLALTYQDWRFEFTPRF